MSRLTDSFHRTIDYMRISITDRCNLRCIYCMPPEGLVPIEHKDILSYEEIVRILRVAVDIGIRKIRITGGEPLVRRNVSYLIGSIKNIEGIEDLSLTTNGIHLEQYAEELVDAGLDRVNISLDSLRPDRYREITRGGDIDMVLNGIEAAEKAGLRPIKINMVPICGLNNDEIGEFAKLTLKSPYQVRFIEFMPFDTNMWSREKFIAADEIKSIVEGIGSLTPANIRKSGPARYFRFNGARGVIGFISPLSNRFCGECSRLRLTADGKLRPCLFSETEIDLKPALRGGAPDDEIERLIKLSIEAKPEGHNLQIQNTELRTLINANKDYKRPMSRIGG
ncbi:MAG: GTP 3',8-cyclase MoaA [Nitrospirae bacterium CG_4_10_14_0_8_um_filter_41_23]|nr:GTP 3',8-cyclase MoaA [Nitrospirota bacterium]OIP59757.1 MAG: cyclic pyranopterin phosphate synthase MoaA [Nitrospirae bacterium CG2_30_41_42]PIQ93699.1 MAG: GTP 3',8-cyclase MoaA [Nitrospirae bacterium CG11_big_fil_rev_8_21_14_0_20_41_14]PIV42195.1 MAG: GTP 3',8-cyclase MoaA [Nitrospirae bacterium CG02_land_8_20_14_3_00_41_53]PIW87949.1 MAG: GTP 3',8-cyclase MoaA [Nitrospirae bacterium CG_4_8_14_3_um_filter_41_47]PIY87031.1 MAG: GTP 3',8-cyclase MoaA [Nitrospirae bacterium CG_4_10_14_0_8_u